MKGVIIHGGLLAVMLAYGYQTWTRDKSVKPTAGQVVMWTRNPADIQRVEYQAVDRTVRLERRGQGADAYWWGVETRTVRRPGRIDPAIPPDPANPPPEETSTDTAEFPVNEAGAKLADDLARMRAVKLVGPIKDDVKKDYGLEDTSRTIAVVFPDGSKTLVVGGAVFGGGDRYVMDVDTNKVFVVAKTLVTPLEGGENALKPLELRAFDAKLARRIEIAATDKNKVVDRIKVKKPAGADPHAAPGAKPEDELIETWGQGATADQTAANFIDKVEKLRPIRFAPAVELSSLTPVVVLTYRDGKGKQLGTIKLLKRPRDTSAPATVPADPDTGEWEYYLFTERTRVPARVPALAADRVEQDIGTVFGTTAATDPGSAPGSAAGSAPGSAAGSAPGSAAGSAPGSAAGSAPGSAAGSAPGSAAGSAAKPGGLPPEMGRIDIGH